MINSHSMFLTPFISAPVDIFIMLLGAFLIGFLIAWLLRNASSNKRAEELEYFQKELGVLHKANENLEIERDRIKVELESCNESKTNLVSQEEMQSTLSDLKKEREKSITARNSLVEIENAHEALKRELESKINQMVSPEEAIRFQAENNRLKVFNSSLQDEIDQLKAELNTLKHGGMPGPSPTATFNKDSDATSSSGGVNGGSSSGEDVSFLSSVGIKAASEHQKDDLKQINGIGPYIEAKLNKIGIYTFEQVASLTDEQVNRITEAIEFFPGRIQRDDWVGQARSLSLS